MSFTFGHPCMFSMDIKQTPETVRKVLDIAGWNTSEAADETRIHHSRINFAAYGSGRLTDEEWRLLLDKAGRRAFDHDGDAE